MSLETRLSGARARPCALCWLLAAVFCLCVPPTAASVPLLDALPAVSAQARQLSNTQLQDSLRVSLAALEQHNRVREAPELAQYVQLLGSLVEPGCCDYFTALPLVKGATDNLMEVLELRMPAQLRPVLRRSYIAAVWLLQRSKFFAWRTSGLARATMAGFFALYEKHVDSAAGRPASLHHISKTAGTTLCSLAGANGCTGPGMGRAKNCLLDEGLDAPVWVLRHDAFAANSLAQPPARAEPDAATQARMPAQQYEWFMYACPAAALPPGRLGRSCSERQEAAYGRAATFFSHENSLPAVHGFPQVCDAFNNVIIVREPVAHVVSLMSEVSMVYARLLHKQRVAGWVPPKWDLSWWEAWAPAVVSSYETRTLLGPAAFCPAGTGEQLQAQAVRKAAAAAAAATPARALLQVPAGAGAAREQQLPPEPTDGELGAGAAAATAGGAWSATGVQPQLQPQQQSPAPWSLAVSSAAQRSRREVPQLSVGEVAAALRMLYSFDAVLQLEQPGLADVSLRHLLGWRGQGFDSGAAKRPAVVMAVPTWQQLEQLATQTPAAEAAGPSPGGAAALWAQGQDRAAMRRSSRARQREARWRKQRTAELQRQQQALPWWARWGKRAAKLQQRLAAYAPAPPPPPSQAKLDKAELSSGALPGEALVRRVLGEVWVRQAYAASGMPHITQPGPAGEQLPPPPLAAVEAAMAALARLNASRVSVLPGVRQLGEQPGGVLSEAPVVLEVELPGQTGSSSGSGEQAGVVRYHLWPKHGVLLDAEQYARLLRYNAADRLLHQHAVTLQALDAAWLSALAHQRGYARLLRRLAEDVGQKSCGFAGLNRELD